MPDPLKINIEIVHLKEAIIDNCPDNMCVADLKYLIKGVLLQAGGYIESEGVMEFCPEKDCVYPKGHEGNHELAVKWCKDSPSGCTLIEGHEGEHKII